MDFTDTQCALIDAHGILKKIGSELRKNSTFACEGDRRNLRISLVQTPTSSSEGKPHRVALVHIANSPLSLQNIVICSLSEIAPYGTSQKCVSWGGDVSYFPGKRAACYVTPPGKLCVLNRMDADFLVLELLDRVFEKSGKTEIALAEVMSFIDFMEFVACPSASQMCSCQFCSWKTLKPLYSELVHLSCLCLNGIFSKKIVVSWLTQKVQKVAAIMQLKGQSNASEAVHFISSNALHSCKVVTVWLSEVYPGAASKSQQRLFEPKRANVHVKPESRPKGSILSFFGASK